MEKVLKNKTAFPWKAFLKSLLAIAVPVALQNLLTTTASMVDTMMIAPLGETSVGAIGIESCRMDRTICLPFFKT